jgi:flagellar biosynthesis/type III secretory pathway protein FliH
VSIAPVAHYLTDFGIKDFPAELPQMPPSAIPVLAEAHWAELIEEAHAKGIAEGRKAAEEQAAAQLEQQQAESQQALAAAREAWTAEAGPRISEQIVSAISQMEQRIADAAERVLRPLMVDAVRAEAIRQLRAILQDLIRSSPDLALQVTGPEDLLDAVRAGIPDSVKTVSYVVSTTTDVQIKAGSSLVETSIGTWLANCGALDT